MATSSTRPSTSGGDGNASPAGSASITMHEIGAQVVLRGVIDESIAAAVAEIVAVLAAEAAIGEVMYALVDLSKVTRADGTLVRSLAELHGAIIGTQGRVIVTHPSAQIQEQLAAAALPFVAVVGDADTSR